MNKGSGNMSRGAAGRRSVGAAGGGMPNGAILNSDDSKLLSPKRKQFNEWAERYRKHNLPNQKVVFDYSKSPKPGK